MTTGYPFKAVEKKWQKKWAEEKTFKVEQPQKKYYVLEMLPYPSGKIHMGHVRNYTIGDAIARFKMMQGYDVLHPMGWDAFGLPAENAAFQNKQHPIKWTYANLAEMRTQLKALGFSYDWEREIATCDVDYYKHEQRLFIEMYNKGLVYQKESWVNWDPVENSVLANEQVVDGRGWRSGALVERKQMRQWFLRITNYAEELLNDLKKLQGGWPDKVLKMQENWIGKSQGSYIDFDDVRVYSTLPQDIFGATFLALAPQHPIVLEHAKDDAKLQAFIEECQHISTAEEVLSTIEKQGYLLPFTVTHPFTNESLPVYAANFVLMEYGTGAVYGCPSTDERDHDFAIKYNLPIIPVRGEDQIMINSDFLTGLPSAEAKKIVIQRLEQNGKGEGSTQFRLRDWGVSRQRYWGCPVPMVNCEKCGTVPETRLPVTLPDDVTFDKPGNPLDHHPTWKHTTCPACKGQALHETDTLDTFFESSWYWLRYCCPNSDEPLDKKMVMDWNPVDFYIGGVEHAVMHLLYARFFTKVLRDLGYLTFDEPFTRLLTQGMVCHKTYKAEDGSWLYPDEVDDYKGKVTIGRSEKMSKSKKNTVDPQYIIDKYGADTTRLFVVSDTPPDKDFDWSDEGLDGCWRYANKMYRVVTLLSSRKAEGLSGISSRTSLQDEVEAPEEIPARATLGRYDKLLAICHKYLQLITQDYDQQAFNKAIAHHRELGHAIEELAEQSSPETCQEVLSIYMKTIAPLMPHLASEILQDLGAWPVLKTELLANQKENIVVQINGKKRAVFEAVPDISEEDLVKEAQQHAAPHLTTPIKKTIVIPHRMVSFVI